MGARADRARRPRRSLELLVDQLPSTSATRWTRGSPRCARGLAHGVYSPDVLRHFAAEGYGGIDVVDRLADVRHPVLVLAGRADRTCSVEAAEVIGAGIPGAELVVFERSGHMTFIEENAAYLRSVSDFLGRHGIAFSEDAASSAHRP